MRQLIAFEPIEHFLEILAASISPATLAAVELGANLLDDLGNGCHLRIMLRRYHLHGTFDARVHRLFLLGHHQRVILELR